MGAVKEIGGTIIAGTETLLKFAVPVQEMADTFSSVDGIASMVEGNPDVQSKAVPASLFEVENTLFIPRRLEAALPVWHFECSFHLPIGHLILAAVLDSVPHNGRRNI